VDITGDVVVIVIVAVADGIGIAVGEARIKQIGIQNGWR